MTPLNFVVICSVPTTAERDGGAHKLPSSVAKGKHARRLLAAGVGKAQSKLGSNNKCRVKTRYCKGRAPMPDGVRSRGAFAPPSLMKPGAPFACDGSSLPPILKFDSSGTLVKAFGEGLFLFPHGLHVDRDGNVGATDWLGKDGKGHQVFKFGPDGRVLMRLGKAGVAGDGPDEFNAPSAVLVAPNGDIFVADQWFQFSRPSGVFIDKKDMIYVADSESESVSKNHDGWKRGIRVGRVRDGVVTGFIPDPVERTTGTSAAEGVAADAQGNIYGAEVGPKRLMKYIKN